LAKRLVAKNENFHTLDTLAAAYAANKQFKKAVSTQEKAIAILVNRSLTNEMGPYMERLKAYQQNRSWRYHLSEAKLSAKAERKQSDEIEDKKVKSEVEKPAIKEPIKENSVETQKPKKGSVAAKEPVKEKPVATPKPNESKVVAKAEKVDPKVAPLPPAAIPKVEKSAANLPAADDLTAKPPTTKQEAASKEETVTTNAPLFVKKRPDSLLAKKRLKKNRLPKKELAPFYPYTIQIASFRDGDKAFFIANHLRQKGDPAFTGPVTIDSSGKWHRVLFGWHTSAEDAQKQLKILKERQFRGPAVVRRPYAVLIESSNDMNRLEHIERRLKELGQLPYRLSDRTKKGYWRILVGAYSDETIPPDFAERLRQNGFQPVMVMR
jgi:hypothetical protein